MNFFKKIFVFIAAAIMSSSGCFAVTTSQSDDLSFYIGSFTSIRPVTSPVLTANIVDRTGNLHTPLSTKFRVITNSQEEKTLYLKANAVTDDGYEEAMFMQGGQVYVAFTNLAKKPKSSALANCKMGGMPDDSPGVVAYPVTSIVGAKNKFIPGKNKYEVYVNNGTTDVTVNIGSNVLRNSFGKNDPRGFYQAVLSLTEADI